MVCLWVRGLHAHTLVLGGTVCVPPRACECLTWCASLALLGFAGLWVRRVPD